MDQLYPLKFRPILKDKIWGGDKLRTQLHKNTTSNSCGESWEISGVKGNESEVVNGYLQGNLLTELTEIYMGDLVGEKIFDQYGLEFPLLIKFIDAAEYLSLQVHPDDELAKKKHQSRGKTEMWYVMEADPDAELIIGFNQSLSKEDYLYHLQNKTLEKVVNREKVSPGDAYFLPAGRIHATGAGILLAEIQQTSDITYRIYDWDRTDAEGNTRELHTNEALEAIDFNAYDHYKTSYEAKNNTTSNIVHCDYFVTNILQFDSPLKKEYITLDSFVIYICLKGRFYIYYNNNTEEYVHVRKGETILIPETLEEIYLHPAGTAKLLEVFIKTTENQPQNHLI